METLDDATLVPSKNHVAAPARFSHEITKPAPYWYDGAGTRRADGELAEGTRVLLATGDGRYCQIIDERGLLVEVACDALGPLSSD